MAGQEVWVQRKVIQKENRFLVGIARKANPSENFEFCAAVGQVFEVANWLTGNGDFQRPSAGVGGAEAGRRLEMQPLVRWQFQQNLAAHFKFALDRKSTRLNS